MVVPSGTPEPMPSGRMLGKYRLLRKLGAGGMGVVFLAQDTVLDRQVALKTLSGRISTHKAFVHRFLREAKAAARLSHPNVVPIYDVLPHEQTAFLVMEYLPGGSVQERLLRHGAFPWLEAVSLVAQAGRGLQAAHEAGLVHCDVKPANLLVGRNGDIKVADFGLVKVLDPEQSPLNTPAQVLGTPHFMSPEQCRGETIDPRSDVYSLAATLYTLVTGTVPFSAENTYGVLYAHCSAERPDPRQSQPELPPALVEVLHTGMATHRFDRYPSMAAFVKALEHLADPTQVAVPGAPGPSAAIRRTLPPPLPALASTRVRLTGIGRIWKPLAAGLAALVLLFSLTGWLVARYGFFPSGFTGSSTTTPPTATPWPTLLAELRAANPAWKGDAQPRLEEGELTDLEMQGNGLVDIRPLQSARHLRSLEYKGDSYQNRGELADLTPVVGLPLKKMRLSLCRVKRLDPISTMGLEELEIDGIDIRDLKGLPSSLRHLSLNSLTINDWSPLERLNQLRSLKIVIHNFQDTSVLERLPLERLQLFATAVRDLTPLRGCPLVRLDIRESRGITNLIPLVECPLREIWIDEARLGEPQIRQALQQMKHLEVVNNIPYRR